MQCEMGCVLNVILLLQTTQKWLLRGISSGILSECGDGACVT